LFAAVKNSTPSDFNAWVSESYVHRDQEFIEAEIPQANGNFDASQTESLQQTAESLQQTAELLQLCIKQFG
jgi:hypothetical protein